MKRCLIVLLILFPIMLMAFGFPGHKTNRPAQNPLRLLQWKLTDYTSYTYENNDWFPDIRMEYYYIANNSTKLDKVVVR